MASISKALIFYHSDAKTAIIDVSKILGYEHMKKNDLYEGAEFYVGKPARKITVLRLSNTRHNLKLWDRDFHCVTTLPVQSVEMCFRTAHRRIEKGWKVDTRKPLERRRCKPVGLTKPSTPGHWHSSDPSEHCVFPECDRFSWTSVRRPSSATCPDPDDVVLPRALGKKPTRKSRAKTECPDVSRKSSVEIHKENGTSATRKSTRKRKAKDVAEEVTTSSDVYSALEPELIELLLGEEEKQQSKKSRKQKPKKKTTRRRRWVAPNMFLLSMNNIIPDDDLDWMTYAPRRLQAVTPSSKGGNERVSGKRKASAVTEKSTAPLSEEERRRKYARYSKHVYRIFDY